MRDPWISEPAALRERMVDPAQVGPAEPEAVLPPYATAFLAHLRLLVGVPFEYLVADPAVLPDESIRFFHLDRSWTDRLVDGVLAVGKVGSREQAHHHAAGPALAILLDALEPAVRPVQRGLAALAATVPVADPDSPVTGFLLRSALVAGWPHMDVRAFRDSGKLPLLRLERLGSAVLLALFAGVPDRVELEEPHHGVQFGVTAGPAGDLRVDPRGPDGTRRDGAPFPVGLRTTDPALRVVEVAELRRIASYRADLDDPGLPEQTGSAALAIELLRPPWRQVYADGTADSAHSGPGELQTSLVRTPTTPTTPAVAGLDVDPHVAELLATAVRSAPRSLPLPATLSTETTS